MIVKMLTRKSFMCGESDLVNSCRNTSKVSKLHAFGDLHTWTMHLLQPHWRCIKEIR